MCVTSIKFARDCDSASGGKKSPQCVVCMRANVVGGCADAGCCERRYIILYFIDRWWNDSIYNKNEYRIFIRDFFCYTLWRWRNKFRRKLSALFLLWKIEKRILNIWNGKIIPFFLVNFSFFDVLNLLFFIFIYIYYMHFILEL